MNTKHRRLSTPPKSMEWRQVGESFGRVVKYGVHTQPVSISHNATKSFLISPWGKRLATIKVCELEGSLWKETGSFAGPKGDWAGRSIALSGDGTRLAIGASGIGEDEERTGHVQVLEYRKGEGYAFIGEKKHLIGIQTHDKVSYSVALSQNGTRIAVGTPRIGYKSGSVKIFELVGDILKPLLEIYKGGMDWGALVMEFLGDDCVQLGQTIAVREAAAGIVVSLSADGGIVVVGVPLSHKKRNKSGAVRVFRYSSHTSTKQHDYNHSKKNKGRWLQIGQKLVGGGFWDTFDEPLSINASGDVLAIGAPLANNEDGCVRLFHFRNNEWNPMGKPLMGTHRSRFGHSVSLAPHVDRLAVGPYDETGGYVKVFEYDGSHWMLIGNILSPLSQSCFGSSVSLSSSGDRLAVGSIHNDGFKKYEHLSIFQFS